MVPRGALMALVRPLLSEEEAVLRGKGAGDIGLRPRLSTVCWWCHAVPSPPLC